VKLYGFDPVLAARGSDGGCRSDGDGFTACVNDTGVEILRDIKEAEIADVAILSGDSDDVSEPDDDDQDAEQ
jgi:hypothetical protein